jgi:peptide/nickel transport system substrate-binding protein
MNIKVIIVAYTLVCCTVYGETELRFCLRTDPKTFDPLLAAEEASETVRYITGGVLVRFNRATQKLEPELAQSWKVSEDGTRIDFTLRKGIVFSDGSPFDAADVVATILRFNDSHLQSPVADAFRSTGEQVRATSSGPYAVSIHFPRSVAGLEFLFDQLVIVSRVSAQRERVTLGPFFVSEYKPAEHVLLRRNPNYWKTDRAGVRLPYVDVVRLSIVSNRENEVLRFRRHEIDFVDRLEPETFERLQKDMPGAAMDIGPSLDSEFAWFNQAPNAPIAEYKRAWFQSQRFRRAVSAAVNRPDMIRLVYKGHATAAFGPISRSNRVWFNAQVRAQPAGSAEALRLLKEDGFQYSGGILKDRQGNRVEFSLITNAGSNTRAQLGALLQQDLKQVGIQVNFTPLEFQSLIERITRTANYEACLLGFTNIELDPDSQINVWLSSSTHHAWNPGQKSPATPWEAEIDTLMRQQAAEPGFEARKHAFDRVQEIIAEQVPIIYLVHPNVLVAVSPEVQNASPSALPPHLYWNIEHLRVGARR